MKTIHEGFLEFVNKFYQDADTGDRESILMVYLTGASQILGNIRQVDEECRRLLTSGSMQDAVKAAMIAGTMLEKMEAEIVHLLGRLNKGEGDCPCPRCSARRQGEKPAAAQGPPAQPARPVVVAPRKPGVH